VTVGNGIESLVIEDGGISILAAGKSLDLDSVVNDNDMDRAPINNVMTWSVEAGTGLATIATDGVLTGLREGTVTVTLTAYNGVSCSKEYFIYVPFKKATLNQSSVTISPDSTYTLGLKLVPTVTNANITGEPTLAVPVKWSVDDIYSDYLSVDPDTGLVTTGSFIKSSIPVKATFTTYEGVEKTLTCKVSIKDKNFKGMSLSQKSISVLGGKQATINAKFNPVVPKAGGADWIIEEGSELLEIVDYSDSYITVAALPTSVEKEAVILAKSKADPEIVARCKVTIKPEAASIKISKDTKDITDTKFDLARGTSKALKAQAFAIDGKSLSSNQKITFKSDNLAVATVTNGGKVSAKENGIAHITAISAENGAVIAGCTVNVVTLSFDKLTADIGLKKDNNTVVITPVGVTEDTELVWSINNGKAGAYLMKDGKAITGMTADGTCQLVLKGLNSGTVKVTATVKGTSKKAHCSVAIFSHVIGIKVSGVGDELRAPDHNFAKTMNKGKTSSIKAAPIYYNYTSRKFVTSSDVKFSSSNPEIVTVSDTGKITAVASGTAYITATTVEGNISKVVKVTVK
jgi:uncharacterized protein YjdB